MIFRTLIAVLMMTPSSFSAASAPPTKTLCKMGKKWREIEIVYTQPEQKVPCQVNYRVSESPEEIQVLWMARNARGYCERKVETFVREKFDNRGWRCGALAAADE